MTSLLYALGNLKLASGTELDGTMEIYQKGYSVSLETSPTHILTGSFHYKLGLINTQKGEYKSARCVRIIYLFCYSYCLQVYSRCDMMYREHMDKALSIAVNRRLDGDTARVRRQLARLIHSDPDASARDIDEAVRTEKQAELTKTKLTEGKGVYTPDGDFDWDSLVCGYYR